MTWQQTIDDEKEDAYEEGLAEGREAGRVEGASQKAIETAENFLRMGVNTIEQISQAIGLPLEKVQEIADRIKIKERS